MKKCTKCKEEKCYSEFCKRKASKDKLNNKCKKCVKEYNSLNKEMLSEGRRKNYIKNIEKNLKYRKDYYIKNKHEISIKQKESQKNKILTPFELCRKRLRGRITEAFKKSKWGKQNKTQDILGADFFTVMNHIEFQFVKNMSWDNRSEWHIDHIIPLALATTEEELIKLCHYTNLQPLWAVDNLKKGSKIL